MHRWVLFKISISYLIAIAAVTSPLLIIPFVSGAGFHDNQRVIEVLCVALSAIIFVGRLFSNPSIKRLCNGYLICLLMLFFLLGLASNVLAYAPRYAFFEWANLLLLIAMSGLIASEIVSRGDAFLDQILRLCGLGCAFYILIEFIIYLVLIKLGGQPSNAALIFGFDNYRFFNHVQTITLPLLSLLTCRESYGKKNVLPWGVMSIWWALLFVSSGRGTFIGMLAGICMSWLCLRKDAWQWCRVMLSSALIGLVIYILFYVLLPVLLGLQPFGFLFSVLDRTIENPDSNRWPLWVRAWELTVAHPWLGVGPLHFAHFGRDLQLGAHPHNWVLQIACEWGIPASLCLVAAVVLGFKRLLAVRQYLAPTDTKNRLTLAAWLTTGVAILVDGLVSGLIVMPTSQLWIALYIGCAWGWAVSMAPIQVETKLGLPIVARVCSAVGLLMLLYFLVNGLWPEIQNLPLHEEQNLQKDLYVNPILRPRIWRAGYF